jgi:hypothetical protein
MIATLDSIVVIATEPMVSTWRAQLDAQPNAKVFSEADFLIALEIIISERPGVIALDPLFAATARGAALVARVKADPRLSRSEVRTLVRDKGAQLALPGSPCSPDRPDRAASMLSQPLDSCGTRRAPRFEMQGDVDARVNGTAGRLVNLSVTGAQMLLPMRVRPGEGIRITLTDDSSDLRLAGTLAWVSLEIAAARATAKRYRFGVEFCDAEEQLLERFCLRHQQD